MEIALQTLTENPMQIAGTVGKRGAYYRANNHRWQLWIKPDGPISVNPPVGGDWLDRRITQPNVNGMCTDEQAADILWAMGLILQELALWERDQPTHYVISRELADLVRAELLLAAKEESEVIGGPGGEALRKMAGDLTANPAERA